MPKSTKRTETIEVQCTPEQKAQIRQYAAGAGTSMSTYYSTAAEAAATGRRAAYQSRFVSTARGTNRGIESASSDPTFRRCFGPHLGSAAGDCLEATG
jgi:hypothetical protein